MKILTIATAFPYPPDNGTKILPYERIRNLSQRHDITLLCISSERVSPDRVTEMEQYCRCVFIDAPLDNRPSTAVGKAWQMLRSICVREPYYIRDLLVPEALTWLAREIPRQEFDVVEADCEASIYLRSPFKAVKVAIMHSVADTLARRELAVGISAARQLSTRVYNTLTRWHQAKLFRIVDLCVTVSEQEGEDLRRLYPGTRVRACLGIGVDADYYSYAPPSGRPEGICFLGKMDYTPNVDAVLWFYHQVLPIVRKTFPAFRFSIIGGHPTDAVKALAQDPNVEVTGYVDDVRPFVRRAGLMALPMRFCGGILNKLLQGMALGVPVVATNRALEGLSAVPNRDLMVADSPEDFAASIVRLATEEDLRLSVSTHGRRYVEQAHQWSGVIRRYEMTLDECVRELRPTEDGGRSGAFLPHHVPTRSGR